MKKREENLAIDQCVSSIVKETGGDALSQHPFVSKKMLTTHP
ncbi:MAG: hypothetical protein V3U88_01155 [Methylococcales bacterium]